MTGAAPPRIGYVAIGRNEGARLVACLASLVRETAGTAQKIVYVDSGSTDGSIEAAERAGAHVVRLDTTIAFTAARARNAGRAALRRFAPGTDYIQFIDGDCELAEGWTATAAAFLDGAPEFAVACGRRRERHPEASLYNRAIDAEWATPVGEALACGGDALFRAGAFDAVGGYRDGLVAGEEPELCLRLREKGWRIMRLDAEMTRHDAAILRFSQWWKRSVRAGHAFAEVSALHGASPKRIWARETARALLWAGLAPLSLLAGVTMHPAFFLLLLAYPAQIIRLAIKSGGPDALAFAALNTAAKFAEAAGVLKYRLARLSGRAPELIEYKT